ncbi:MAG: hypothetical protein H6667_12265 [Ardenticatenaceae bacterium]|nr:hypothetical protein [Ardenticatenaceae bacterium]MCB9443591.1 hypothetical protein [Ardenticatenaceae bacterium]
MKRYMIVGIAVVAILGIAITMALASNPAAADNLFDGTAQVGTVSEDSGDAATAVTQDPIANPAGQNFVDEDGDGVCDTCGNVPGTGTGNQNGNGAAGENFVDLDGDGICDDCEPLAPADGTGNQYGRQGGQGGQGAGIHQSTTQLDGTASTTSQNGNGATGDNFVDLDGDGICDDCTPYAPADGTGNQYGRQGGQGGQGQRGGGRGNAQN